MMPATVHCRAARLRCRLSILFPLPPPLLPPHRRTERTLQDLCACPGAVCLAQPAAAPASKSCNLHTSHTMSASSSPTPTFSDKAGKLNVPKPEKFPFCRPVQTYTRQELLGEGTFG